MLALFAIEQAGVPLVAHLVDSVAVPVATKLAVVFLISNLLPVLLISPPLGGVLQFLKRLWPDTPVMDDPSRPMFLRSQALDDVSSAFDLMRKELARLLGTIHLRTAKQSPEEEAPPRAFQDLALAIENFAAKLASRSSPSQADASRLHLLRAELSIVRHVEEGIRYFAHAIGRQGGPAILSETLEKLLSLATSAAQAERTDLIQELLARTKLKGEEMSRLKETIASALLTTTALFEDFSIAVRTIRRLELKTYDRLTATALSRPLRRKTPIINGKQAEEDKDVINRDPKHRAFLIARI
jgi:hypothetical protein